MVFQDWKFENKDGGWDCWADRHCGMFGGAATLAFYKAPQLKLLSHHHHYLLGYLKQHDQSHSQSDTTWIKGCFFLLLSSTFYGLWLVLQAFLIKDYPSKLIFTTLQCFLSSIQSLAVAFAIERDIRQWKLGWNVTLLAVAYCVILSISYILLI